MPALNFTMFVDKVETGEKRTTIRRMRKHPIKLGDRLVLYTGMRTKNCRRIIPLPFMGHLGAIVARKVCIIGIEGTNVWINGFWMLTVESEEIARADGFDSLEDFAKFFKGTKENPFIGQLIEW